MTKEIEEIDEMFDKLKKAASEKSGVLPDGFDSETDIHCFLDLCLLFDNRNREKISKDEAMRLGVCMRANYINAVKCERRRNEIAVNDLKRLRTWSGALTEITTNADKLTAEQREKLYLKIIGAVFNEVAEKEIRNKIKKAKKEGEKNAQ